MSKKITLSLSDKNRPNLSALFQSYMKNRKSSRRLVNLGGMLIDMDDEEYSAMVDYWDSVFPGWDKEGTYPSEDDYSDEEFIFPGRTLNNTKAGKKGKRKNDPYKEYWKQEEREERWARNLMGKSTGKTKHKRHGRTSRARIIDINDYEYDEITPPKVIFYPDYHDQTDKMCFRNIMEFNDFCEENGYSVPAYVVSDLVYRTENHCCLDPMLEERGELSIVGEGSYGELFYEVCKPEELA